MEYCLGSFFHFATVSEIGNELGIRLLFPNIVKSDLTIGLPIRMLNCVATEIFNSVSNRIIR